MYAEPGWARVASLAPAVVQCAGYGDFVAQQIMQEGVADLVTMVQAAVKQLRMLPKFTLVLAGAVFATDRELACNMSSGTFGC